MATRQRCTVTARFVCMLQKAREMFKIMDKALEPLTDQLKAVAAISPPDFGAYPTWLQQQAALKQRLDGKSLRVLFVARSHARKQEC